MENLILIEKNFWKNKRNIIMLVVLLLMLPLLLFFNKSILSREKSMKVDFLKEDYQNLTLIYLSSDSQKKLVEWADEYPEKQKEVFFKYHNQEIKYLKNVNKGRVPLDIENVFLKDYKSVIELNGNEDVLSDSYLKNKIKVNDYLLNLEMEEESIRYGVTGAGFLNFLINTMCSLLGMLLLIYIFGDSFGKAFELEKIYLNFSQPKNKKNFLLSHLFSSYIHSIFFLVLFFSIGFFLSSLFFGIGNFSYPILVSGLEKSTFIPIWKYWLGVIFFFLIDYFFILLLYQLFIVFMKKSMISFICLVITVLLCHILSIGLFKSVGMYSPFTFINPVQNIIGLDYNDLKYVSGGYADGLNVIKGFRLFIQNESYFIGDNISHIINKSFSVKRYLFIMVTSMSIIQYCLVKKINNNMFKIN